MLEWQWVLLGSAGVRVEGVSVDVSVRVEVVKCQHAIGGIVVF